MIIKTFDTFFKVLLFITTTIPFFAQKRPRYSTLEFCVSFFVVAKKIKFEHCQNIDIILI